MKIHSTAIVDKKAKLADDVEVGPYTIIGPDVEIEASTKIGPHVVITGYTSIGKNCSIFPGACVGTIPQDLKYKGEESLLKIGNNNIIREYVTINPGSEKGSETSIGDGNLLMAYSHVAHNCSIGNGCIIANLATLAGHVFIEDKVVMGGIVGIHQFVRVGKMAIIGGCSKVVQDIPPFSTCDGRPARVYGLNLLGLKRAEISMDAQRSLKKAFRVLFHSGASLKSAIHEVNETVGHFKEIDYLLEFLKGSKRGVCRGDRAQMSAD